MQTDATIKSPLNEEYWLYEAFRDIAFEWLISNEILAEYEEQLATADYLVTQDRHFRVLRDILFPTVSVVALKEFKKILSY